MQEKRRFKSTKLIIAFGALLVLSIAFLLYFFGVSAERKLNETSSRFFDFNPPEGSKEVPIVVAFDNNYTCPALVSLSSLFENANNDTYYKIYLIITDEFSQENKNSVMKLGQKYKNFGVRFINISEEAEEFKNLNIFSERFSKEMFYRLKIPNLLSNEDKCIYMDVDTIILKDMSELYEQDISSYYIGGVVDGTRISILGDDHKKTKEREEYYQKLGVDNMADYINSGVILWNLKECRKANVEEKFLNFVKTSHEKYGLINDQDTFNSVCHGKIKDLPLKFNTQTYLKLDEDYKDIGYLKRYVSKNEWEEAKTSPVLIHYALEKPWKEPTKYFFQRWWIWARKAPDWVWNKVVEYAKFLKEEPK